MQVCTSLQKDNHASTPPLSFFTDRMPFLPATNSIKALKAYEGLNALKAVLQINGELGMK